MAATKGRVFIKTDPGSRSFGEFPPEIRNRIYDFYYPTDKPHIFPFKGDGGRTLAFHERHPAAPLASEVGQRTRKPNTIALLFTCRAAYFEGSGLLFKNKTLHIVNLFDDHARMFSRSDVVMNTMLTSELPLFLARKFPALVLAIYNYPYILARLDDEWKRPRYDYQRYGDHSLWDVVVDNFRNLESITIQCLDYLAARNLAARLTIKPKYKSGKPEILFKLSILPTTSTDPFQTDDKRYYHDDKLGRLTTFTFPAVEKFIISSRIVPIELDLIEKATFNGHYLRKVGSRKYVQDWHEYVPRFQDGMKPWVTPRGTELVEHTYALEHRPKSDPGTGQDEIDMMTGLRAMLYPPKEKLEFGKGFEKALRGFKF